MLKAADERKLRPLLADLIRAVEGLALSGLTAASDATRQQLGASFQEASRLRLLRLGSALRVANEELGRFTAEEQDFSPKRLLLFLSHAWSLAHGLLRALDAGDQAAWERLAGTPSRRPLAWVEAVALGTVKKVVPGAFCAFEFRLRVVAASDQEAAPPGAALTWSCVFPLPKGVQAAETFLHTELPQKFRPRLLLDKKVVRFEDVALADDGRGGPGRILLGPDSRAHAGEAFEGWARFVRWDPAAALADLAAHQPTPLDLEVEPTHEVVLPEWRLTEAEPRDGRVTFELEAQGVTCEVGCPPGAEGEHLAGELRGLAEAPARPPLFALAHYARCRVVLRPLSLLEPAGPRELNLAPDAAKGAAELLRKLRPF